MLNLKPKENNFLKHDVSLFNAANDDCFNSKTRNITNKSLATRYLENQTTHSTGSRNGWYGSRAAPRNLKNNSSTTKYNTGKPGSYHNTF